MVGWVTLRRSDPRQVASSATPLARRGAIFVAQFHGRAAVLEPLCVPCEGCTTRRLHDDRRLFSVCIQPFLGDFDDGCKVTCRKRLAAQLDLPSAVKELDSSM